MKITEIRVMVGYTFQIEQYHPIKGEYSVLSTVADGDDIESVKADLKEFAVINLLDVLDELSGVHRGIADSGTLEPGSLSADFVTFKEKEADEAASEDDDGEWMT